jgi:hypothetical protein
MVVGRRLRSAALANAFEMNVIWTFVFLKLSPFLSVFKICICWKLGLRAANLASL